ncbi:apurinic endonuclease Apn1 [Allomeiothermus silvanus DSM 9946]|uniref:Apurinic endonuclease Apn1 n=1 Tax=Allomeiothermus silvanus (strain ATCC 700542 / DSM 9946 / NBRC 106475 / NCIMB 13440 / VI-R2) TaxID=526227 RepID=D7BH52_ALLS1|nr:deoxyribonuclease IV [Allomeiothermus silvanus]ADH63905.1 apurinic endonuclease Apn1 [Allomeiothermus silvanus DSM 9946]
MQSIHYGFHLSIAGKQGVAGAVAEAQRLGLSGFQIFAKSPRSWKTRNLGPGEVERFRAGRENLGHLPAAIHASYLVNLGATGELWEKSIFSLADDLTKAQVLGIELVVVHPGSGEKKRIREGALRALELAQIGKRGPKLLLENTAGGGERIGSRLEDLAWLIEGTPLGVCFDTCHAFAAGYPLHLEPERVIEELDQEIGLERVPLIHLNDSVGAWGSHIDQHANLRQGRIGEALREVVCHPRLRGKLFVMETERGETHDAHNLATLRRWLESCVSLRESSEE